MQKFEIKSISLEFLVYVAAVLKMLLQLQTFLSLKEQISLCHLSILVSVGFALTFAISFLYSCIQFWKFFGFEGKF